MDHARDGLRVLATRYIPRGCPHTRYDVWMANLAPSEKLLKGFLSKEIAWKEFARRYEAQIFEAGAVDKENPRIKNHGQKFTLRLIKELTEKQHVTLMCNCATDEPHCHLRVLEKVLRSRKV